MVTLGMKYTMVFKVSIPLLSSTATNTTERALSTAAPLRLYSLMVNTRQALLDSTFTASTTTSGIKTLLTSPNHILSSLFPMALRSERGLHGTKSVSDIFRKLYHSPLPLALLRDEIQQKKTTLTSFRTQQAATLGLLIKQAPQFTAADPTQQLQVTSLDQVAKGTTQCVKALTLCLRGSGNNNGLITSSAPTDIQAMIGKKRRVG